MLRKFLALGFLATTAMRSQTPPPPAAPRVDHRETRHGATVIDPYFWLREKSNPQIKQTDLSVPTRRGGFFYYSRTEEGKHYPIQCRRKGSMDAPEEVLLDLNALGKDRKFVGLGALVVSDDHNLLAYTIDYTGFRQFALQVKDLRNGQTMTDRSE